MIGYTKHEACSSNASTHFRIYRTYRQRWREILKKRILVILLVLIALAGAGLAAYRFLAPPASASGPGGASSAAGEVVQIGRKTLVDTVSATGSIEPEAEVDMKFETGGMVKEVLVKQGQTITAGAVLARLDTGDLEFQVRSAEIDLAQAKANLDQLYEPELAEKVAAAKAKVESAQLTLADLEGGPDPDEVTKAEAALKQEPKSPCKKAQWAYDQVSYRGDVGAMSQANELQEATLDYELALADYNMAVKKATPAETGRGPLDAWPTPNRAWPSCSRNPARPRLLRSRPAWTRPN